MSVFETLHEARNLIVKYGWIQGRLGNKECGFCVGGALIRVTSTGDEWWYALRAFEAQIPEGEIRPEESIPIWNDKPERTVGDVLAVFDKAIRAELEKGKQQ